MFCKSDYLLNGFTKFTNTCIPNSCSGQGAWQRSVWFLLQSRAVWAWRSERGEVAKSCAPNTKGPPITYSTLVTSHELPASRLVHLNQLGIKKLSHCLSTADPVQRRMPIISVGSAPAPWRRRVIDSPSRSVCSRLLLKRRTSWGYRTYTSWVRRFRVSPSNTRTKVSRGCHCRCFSRRYRYRLRCRYCCCSYCCRYRLCRCSRCCYCCRYHLCRCCYCCCCRYRLCRCCCFCCSCCCRCCSRYCSYSLSVAFVVVLVLVVIVLVLVVVAVSVVPIM